MKNAMWRRRKTQKAYIEHLKKHQYPCDFCATEVITEQLIVETAHFYILENSFPYDTWDHNTVEHHIMIVPKRHIESISKLTPAEAKDYLLQISKYEASGYSVYSRAANNKSKSYPHLHTHLLKLGEQRRDFFLYVGKPHIVLYK